MEVFRYGCTVSGEHFCSRPELARQMCRYVEAGQNFVIQGDRRMGKTSLVSETLSRMRGWKVIYADFMGVKSVTDVCNRVADALARFDADDNLFRKTLSFLAHLRPVATFDPMTSIPTISVDAAATKYPESVNVIISAIEKHAKGRKVCVVFDEFQDILDLKSGDQVLALMRSKIQFLGDIPFVFLGSSRKDMLQIFMSPKSPFFKSALLFDVPAIPDDVFYRFVCKRFAIGGRTITREMFGRVLDFVNRTTGDVQEMCDALWHISEKGEALDETSFETALRLIFARESAGYATMVKQLTDIQLRVLKALAELGGAHPLSAEFLSRARISTPTSVKRSLTALYNAEIIYGPANEYRFLNPFFREWIRRGK